MPRPPAGANSLRMIVDDFVARLMSAVEADASQRIRDSVLRALEGGTAPRRRGRPPKNGWALPAAGSLSSLGPVKRRQRQLCPVPGCQNPAAPVFGMLCAQHKDTPKSLVKKYREERRAAKREKRD